MSDAAVDLVRLHELAVDANCEGGAERDELNRYLTPARVLDLTARLASAQEYGPSSVPTLRQAIERLSNDNVLYFDEITRLKATVEQAHERTRTIMDAFRGCPDHVYQHEGCVMCEGRGQTIDRMVAALTSAAGGPS